MTRPEAPVADNATEALLEHIGRVRRERRTGLLEEAEGERARMLAEARRRAHARIRQTVREQRAHRARELAHARATAEAALRHRRQELQLNYLERAWQQLDKELARRWRDGAARRQWLDGLLRLAVDRLPDGDWVLEHPEDAQPEHHWSVPESVAEQRPDVTLTMRALTDLQAGYRLRAGKACLDASVAALMGREQHLKGLLLGRIEQRLRTAPGQRAAGEAQ